MKELFTLGDIYVSDFLKVGEEPRGGKDELRLIMDDDGAVRLSHPSPVNTVFGKYWYRSGINESMKCGLKDVVDSILSVFKIDEGDIWLDIASNDGTLFTFLPKKILKVGIDPADDSFKKEAEKVSDLIIQDYFSAEVYRNGLEHYKKAKVVTSIAVFYDIEDREGFLADVYDVMDDNGLWVLQQSYTPLMLQQVAFDNLCHEHYYYYSLFNIKKLLERNGFKIMDCQINDINGGSFRLYVMKDAGDEKLFASQPHRDVCNYRIESVLCYEKTLCLDYKSTWCVFFDKINDLKERVTDFIRNEKQHGKTIAGYGASTKGNTLLQYFELDNTVIDFIADRSPYKWGRKTIGTNIPIISEKIMRIVHPDYLLILPWHFITEFTKRESEYLQKGGHFIVPCPKLQII